MTTANEAILGIVYLCRTTQNALNNAIMHAEIAVPVRKVISPRDALADLKSDRHNSRAQREYETYESSNDGW